MRALVTGAAGFVGRHTARELAMRGYTVDMIDIRPIPRVPGGRAFPIAVESLPGNAGPAFSMAGRYDLVVHCAAVVGGRNNIEAKPIRD